MFCQRSSGSLLKHFLTMRSNAGGAMLDNQQQALVIRRPPLGERLPEYGACVKLLELFLVVLGRHAEAEPLYQQAMEISQIGKRRGRHE